METQTEVQFKIGADFCIPRGDRRTYRISCDINDGKPTRSRAFPTPDRAWLMQGDLLYRAPVHETPNTQDFIEFLSSQPNRVLLAPDAVFPPVLRTTDDGGLLFDFTAQNVTLPPSLLPPDVNLGNFRDAIIYAVLGEWACVANNTFGVDSATSVISECGKYCILVKCRYMHHSVPVHTCIPTLICL